MRIANRSTIRLGAMRVRKNGSTVYVQERVHGGWEYTQLHPKQTLTSIIAELKRRGFEFAGRDPLTVADPHVQFYYYTKPE